MNQILKYRNANGKCTHKKNNHRFSKGLITCSPKDCPYFIECKIGGEYTDNMTGDEFFEDNQKI